MTWDIKVGDCVELMKQLPDNSIDAIVTDPPYGIGFQGRAWDALPPGLDWAQQCYRVLKPGGHVVAFGGSRTIHRLTTALEDAEFAIRDVINWVYYCGFPKNHNISAAIDRQKHNRDQVLKVTAWIKSARDNAGIKNQDIDEAFGFKSMAGHWTTQATQPTVPTLEQVPKLLDVLKLTLQEVPDEIRDLLWTINGNKGQPGPNWAKREVIGHHERPNAAQVAWGDGKGQIAKAITTSATDAARNWEGFGTALKPAYEPAVLARKPVEGSIASNVLKYGTGALNIDRCRYKYGDRAWPQPDADKAPQATQLSFAEIAETNAEPHEDLSRWPANLYHCPKPTRAEKERGCEHLSEDRVYVEADNNPYLGSQGQRVKNNHPTVKPIGVMSWLCKLVGGKEGSLILDPFTGSGTTGIAAVNAGFDFLGFELNENYAQIASARIVGSAPLFNRRGTVVKTND